MTEFNFIGNRRYLYLLSLIVFIGSPLIIGIRGFNLGLDFVGGSEFRYRFDREVSPDEIRAVTGQKTIQDLAGNVTIQRVLYQGEGETLGHSEFIVRSTRDLSEEATFEQRLTEALAKGLSNVNIEPLSSTIIGPVVGSNLKSNTKKAVFFAVLIILLYMWMRFDLRPGITSTIALAHDTFAVLGAVALVGYQVDITTVAAVLTVLGYSLNDSIVILDRVRENLRLKKKVPYDELVNTSINQSLTRTIYTSVTTLLTLITLFMFGPEILRNFAFTLVIGIISGTLSTICIVTPLLVDWHHRDHPPKKA